jgi:hypothetical protein
MQDLINAYPICSYAICNSFRILVIPGLCCFFLPYSTHWHPIKTLLQPNVQHKIEQVQSKI